MPKSSTNPLFDLTGRRALISGSTQGIGLALAYGLARSGASVVLNGRDKSRVRTVAAKMLAEGFKADYAAFDVTQKPAVVEAIDHIEKDFGPIDILINNAGIQHVEAVEKFPSDKWEQIIAINLSSTFYATRAAIPITIE